jgi:pyrroloquinoline quinone biosynthesis protein B
MRIRLLGTAAGGGFPQWNCRCRNCIEARAGSGGAKSRMQSCVAISADGLNWFLLNASPDLLKQMNAFAPLHPRGSGATRGSPVQAVLLTNADLDHTLGLVLLRESAELNVHATAETRDALARGLNMPALLNAFTRVNWIEPPQSPAPLPKADASASGLRYRAVPLAGKPPRWMANMGTKGHSIAYDITDERSGGRLLFMPDVQALDGGVAELIREADAVLFDGTFWSNDEMIAAGFGTTTALEMGHMPVSSERGSLRVLQNSRAKRKIYLHINNTNPMLLENSAERAAVIESGVEIGEDGSEFEI